MRKYKEELSSRDFTIKSLEADILNNQAEINRFKQENENLQKKILTVLQVGNSEKERQLTDMQKYMDGDREELNQIKEKYRKLKLFSKKILEENQKNQRNSEKLSSKMKKSGINIICLFTFLQIKNFGDFFLFIFNAFYIM